MYHSLDFITHPRRHTQQHVSAWYFPGVLHELDTKLVFLPYRQVSRIKNSLSTSASQTPPPEYNSRDFRNSHSAEFSQSRDLHSSATTHSWLLARQQRCSHSHSTGFVKVRISPIEVEKAPFAVCPAQPSVASFALGSINTRDDNTQLTKRRGLVNARVLPFAKVLQRPQLLCVQLC